MFPTEWIVSASASNDVATATKAAPSNGDRHTLSVVVASFSDSTASNTLTITVTLAGTSTTVVHMVHGADVVPLEIRGDVDAAVSAALAAGGAGVTGRVSIIGHTGS